MILFDIVGDFPRLKHFVVNINIFVKLARVNKKLRKGLLNYLMHKNTRQITIQSYDNYLCD